MNYKTNWKHPFLIVLYIIIFMFSLLSGGSKLIAYVNSIKYPVVDVCAQNNPDRFHLAFINLIKEEGEYSNDLSDPGGETKFGISKQSYPELSIKSLTLEDAKNIYRRDYWEKIRGDELPSDKLAIEVMEEAVNMGTRVAVSFLQAAVLACGGNTHIDGVLGQKTMTEINKIDPEMLLNCIQAQSLSYYMSLVRTRPVLRKFLKGWFNRVLT